LYCSCNVFSDCSASCGFVLRHLVAVCTALCKVFFYCSSNCDFALRPLVAVCTVSCNVFFYCSSNCRFCSATSSGSLYSFL
jgi:hypothetical protein